MNTKHSFMRPVILVVFGVLFGVGIVAGFGGLSKLNLAFGSNDNVVLGGQTPNTGKAPSFGLIAPNTRRKNSFQQEKARKRKKYQEIPSGLSRADSVFKEQGAEPVETLAYRTVT